MSSLILFIFPLLSWTFFSVVIFTSHTIHYSEPQHTALHFLFPPVLGAFPISHLAFTRVTNPSMSLFFTCQLIFKSFNTRNKMVFHIYSYIYHFQSSLFLSEESNSHLISFPSPRSISWLFLQGVLGFCLFENVLIWLSI